jgi:hypothetical protein
LLFHPSTSRSLGKTLVADGCFDVFTLLYGMETRQAKP